MSSQNLHRYMKEYLKFQPKTLSYSQIEELIEYDAWLESQSGLTPRAADVCPRGGLHDWLFPDDDDIETCEKCGTRR